MHALALLGTCTLFGSLCIIAAKTHTLHGTSKSLYITDKGLDAPCLKSWNGTESNTMD